MEHQRQSERAEETENRDSSAPLRHWRSVSTRMEITHHGRALRSAPRVCVCADQQMEHGAISARREGKAGRTGRNSRRKTRSAGYPRQRCTEISRPRLSSVGARAVSGFRSRLEKVRGFCVPSIASASARGAGKHGKQGKQMEQQIIGKNSRKAGEKISRKAGKSTVFRFRENLFKKVEKKGLTMCLTFSRIASSGAGTKKSSPQRKEKPP